jgi:cytochrome P450
MVRNSGQDWRQAEMIQALPCSKLTGAGPVKAPAWRGFARGMRDNGLTAFPPEAYEEDVVVRRFFGRHVIVMSRPAGIQHILVDNPANYRRTPASIRMLRPLLGNGVLLSEGEDWRQQRRTLAPAFAPRTLAILARHMARAAAIAVADLKESEAPIDLLAKMQFLALEIAGTSMFSIEMERYGAELRHLITSFTTKFGRPRLLDFVLPIAVPSPHDLPRRRFRRRWLDLIGRMIAARRQQGSAGAPRDLFDLMANAQDPESGDIFPPDRLADEVATMIAAGHETTGLALFWSLYLLAGAPDTQERVAAEVGALDLGPDNAAEALPQLVYTRAVVHETMRLYPPVYTLARLAIAADNAGGISVSPGAMVLIAPWVLHRHRRLWPQPETFEPDRFLPGKPLPDRFAYLPFGAGPRVCIGAQFALTEAALVLATMIQAFHIERSDDAPVIPWAVITTQPDHSPRFWLRPRTGQEIGTVLG